MAERLTRVERRQRTRDELLATARMAFLRDGFHGASLEAIAEEAGYTRGAVYSNFESKEDLLLSVLDSEVADRVQAYHALALEESTLDEAIRAVGRHFAAIDPEWRPLIIEIQLQAARRPALRAALLGTDRMLDSLSRVVVRIATRFGVETRVPAREVARASRALGRGMTLERLVDPGAGDAAMMEELFVALTMALVVDPSKEGGRRA